MIINVIKIIKMTKTKRTISVGGAQYSVSRAESGGIEVLC